jgi:hypothetical protein
MIEFKLRNFSIKGGYYTGPKDIEELPSVLETVGKGALGGTVLGGIFGKMKEDVPDGVKKGGMSGAIGGLAYKILLNHLHKPMKEVKFNEVDKYLRKEFGLYKIGGLTVLGDNVENNSKLEERFSFDDRNITNYKINVAITNNKVILYTFCINNEELGNLDKILDKYCKKYYGMSYVSKVVNSNINSYSVNITFTNYDSIANFLIEVSNCLKTKVNLLSNYGSGIVLNRISDYGNYMSSVDIQNSNPDKNNVERSFSFINNYLGDRFSLDKADLIRILGNTGANIIGTKLKGKGVKACVSSALISALTEFIKSCKDAELVKLGVTSNRYKFGNSYLKLLLKKLHYTEGVNYTVGVKESDNNVSLANGVLFITVSKNSDSESKIDNSLWKSFRSVLVRSEVGRAVSYSYIIRNKEELELIINKLMSLKIKFNVFDI